MLEDVTLREGITVHVRFKGGATQTITLPRPLRAGKKFRTNPDLVTEINRLLEHHTGQMFADLFNARGLRPGKTDRFSGDIINGIQKDYGLP